MRSTSMLIILPPCSIAAPAASAAALPRPPRTPDRGRRCSSGGAAPGAPRWPRARPGLFSTPPGGRLSGASAAALRALAGLRRFGGGVKSRELPRGSADLRPRAAAPDSNRSYAQNGRAAAREGELRETRLRRETHGSPANNQNDGLGRRAVPKRRESAIQPLYGILLLCDYALLQYNSLIGDIFWLIECTTGLEHFLLFYAPNAVHELVFLPSPRLRLFSARSSINAAYLRLFDAEFRSIALGCDRAFQCGHSALHLLAQSPTAPETVQLLWGKARTTSNAHTGCHSVASAVCYHLRIALPAI